MQLNEKNYIKKKFFCTVYRNKLESMNPHACISMYIREKKSEKNEKTSEQHQLWQ